MSKKTKQLLFAAMLSLLSLSSILSACSDEPDVPAIDPSLEQTGNYIISTFTLAHENFSLAADIDSVRIALISKSGIVYNFGASLERDASHWRFHMSIPETEQVPDGDYILTLKHPEGKAIPGRLSVRFNNQLISSVNIILPTYMLDGSGTEDDPYLIKNDEDFTMFLINLSDDADSYGAGLKFLQTSDITAPDQSSIIPGRGYWGAPFAGIYDGGGHTVTGMFYRGSGRDSSDTGIGLFNSLLGNAMVENLDMKSVAVTGLHSRSGIIAGTTSGEIQLSNISVSGYFEDGYAIGGLVGCADGGSLTITDARLKASVAGTNDVGGLVGLVNQDVVLTVSNVTTPDYHFSISGGSSVGGILGRCNGKATLSNIRLEHKVSGEDADIHIIEATGSGVGGIIGTATAEASTITLYDCYVLAPVGGKKASNVGGLIGQTFQASPIHLDNCRVYSVVEGKSCTGGVLGRGEFPENAQGMRISGADLSTRVATDDAEAKISGGDHTGGFAGWWQNGSLSVDSRVKINLPVTASGRGTGGVFGYISHLSVSTEKFLIGRNSDSSPIASTMKVEGGNDTGGFAGIIEGLASIAGNAKFDFSENGKPISVPDKGRFTPAFAGVVTGKSNVGGIAGNVTTSQIRHISSSAHVTGNENVGGVIGRFTDDRGVLGDDVSQIEDCTFAGIINCPESSCVGGIIGFFKACAAGLVHDCVNYADITGADNTGGVIGYVEKSRQDLLADAPTNCDIKWCVNVGQVTGTYHVGGITGQSHVISAYAHNDAITTTDLSFSYCMNAGKIIGHGGKSYGAMGGIAGFTNYLTGISHCANHGEICGEGEFHGIGGIAGSMGNDPTGASLTNTFRNVDLLQCVNTGQINSENTSTFVGGMLGYQEEGNRSDVRNCHNLGAVFPHQKHDSGGIVGCVDHLCNIYYCVNRGMVSHGNATIGTHKSGSLFDHDGLYFLEGTGGNWPSATKVSAADFTKESSFSKLDFEKVWMMGPDGPELRDCPWKDYKK